MVAVPDLFLTAVKLTHDKTGAKYLHAARDDSNNLFRCEEWFQLCHIFKIMLNWYKHSKIWEFLHSVFICTFNSKKMSNIHLNVFQCPVQDDPYGQHRGSTHPWAHSALWIEEVSLQRPFLQDAQQVSVHLHERLHRYNTRCLYSCVNFLPTHNLNNLI